ncbi:conserved membrane hypothetical protein [Candidatus Terasakiella magnetica]|nr:conserved membrane hypothetical protein [Candidatus Terasakiella magnetica]
MGVFSLSPRWEFTLLRLWHASLVGSFAVAYVTADEDTYRMHLFAGYWVVATVAVRLALHLIGSETGPLRLKRPAFTRVRPGRNPLFAWMAVLLLAAMALGGVSGILADALPALEDLHEGLAESSLWLVLAHALIIAWIFQGRRVREFLSGTGAKVAVLALLVLPVGIGTALAADTARDAIVGAYARQAKAADAAFAGFSPVRGAALFTSKNTSTPDLPSCTTCHTADPTQPGRHAKTGRVINPVAVSVNAKRFTEADKVEDRFARDCQTVLGRACTAVEKGDYIAYMASK